MKRIQGFSLMEMMVVLLITAIVMAAAAPMVNKKMLDNRASETSPWLYQSGIGSSITYNWNGRNDSAVIGAPTADAYGIGSQKPRLYLRTGADDQNSHIAFRHGNKTIELTSTDSSIFMNTAGSSRNLENAVTIGDATVSSDDSVVVGYNSQARGDASTAIGRDATSFSQAGTAIGAGAQAQMFSTSIGSTAISRQNGATTVGFASSASSNGVALGRASSAANSGVALGYGSVASGTLSVAIGSSPIENLGVNVAMAPTMFNLMPAAYAIGGFGFDFYEPKEPPTELKHLPGWYDPGEIPLAETPDWFNQAIGNGNNAGDDVVQPVTTEAQGVRSVAIGYLTTAGDADSIAIGTSVSASSTDTISIGNATVAGGVDCLAIGRGATATGSNAGTIGGGRAIAIGSQIDRGPVSATGRDSIAMGTSANTSHPNAIAIGHLANASNNNAVALGEETDATGEQSLALGAGAQALHTNSTAIGIGASTTKDNQIVLGNSNTTVFIPGDIAVAGNVYVSEAIWAGTIFQDMSTTDTSATVDGHNYRPVLVQKGAAVNKNLDAYGRFIPSKNRENLNPYLKEMTEKHNDAPKHYVTSDRRLKNVGKAFTAGLEEIKKLEVFNYTFKKDKEKTPRVGVMAQDLEKIFPNAVQKGDDGFLRIRMEDMFYAVVNAIKELDNKITSLINKEIKNLQSELISLKDKNKELEDGYKKLKKENQELVKRLEALEKKVK